VFKNKGNYTDIFYCNNSLRDFRLSQRRFPGFEFSALICCVAHNLTYLSTTYQPLKMKAAHSFQMSGYVTLPDTQSKNPEVQNPKKFCTLFSNLKHNQHWRNRAPLQCRTCPISTAPQNYKSQIFRY
jgi:hypothetical protein